MFTVGMHVRCATAGSAAPRGEGMTAVAVAIPLALLSGYGAGLAGGGRRDRVRGRDRVVLGRGRAARDRRDRPERPVGAGGDGLDHDRRRAGHARGPAGDPAVTRRSRRARSADRRRCGRRVFLDRPAGSPLRRDQAGPQGGQAARLGDRPAGGADHPGRARLPGPRRPERACSWPGSGPGSWWPRSADPSASRRRCSDSARGSSCRCSSCCSGPSSTCGR